MKTERKIQFENFSNFPLWKEKQKRRHENGKKDGMEKFHWN